MKKSLNLILVSLAVLTLAACNQSSTAETKAQVPAEPAQPAAAEAPAAPNAAGTSGTVVETMNTGGYTYVQVDDGKQKLWAAAPEFSVSVGDSVVVPEGMPMQNFHSKTLDRDFDVVYFVDSVLNASAPTSAEAAEPTASAMPEGHPDVSKTTTPADIDLRGIPKAEGGLTVGEIYADKANLSGKEITLRAKVVKFTPQIMGTNWLHIQDGTGNAEDGSNDLTVTSKVSAQAGDTVLIKGTLTLDKDFGYGYQYALIVEDGNVTVE